jgi:hypothetical protein
MTNSNAAIRPDTCFCAHMKSHFEWPKGPVLWHEFINLQKPSKNEKSKPYRTSARAVRANIRQEALDMRGSFRDGDTNRLWAFR